MRQRRIETILLEHDEKIEKLEKDSHPPCPLECFDGYDELIKKIQKLEKYHQLISMFNGRIQLIYQNK